MKGKTWQERRKKSKKEWQKERKKEKNGERKKERRKRNTINKERKERWKEIVKRRIRGQMKTLKMEEPNEERNEEEKEKEKKEGRQRTTRETKETRKIKAKQNSRKLTSFSFLMCYFWGRGSACSYLFLFHFIELSLTTPFAFLYVRIPSNISSCFFLVLRVLYDEVYLRRSGRL